MNASKTLIPKVTGTLAIPVLTAAVMLLMNIVTGTIPGLCSGGLYVLLRIPPIIISLGVTLIMEGITFTQRLHVRLLQRDQRLRPVHYQCRAAGVPDLPQQRA